MAGPTEYYWNGVWYPDSWSVWNAMGSPRWPSGGDESPLDALPQRPSLGAIEEAARGWTIQSNINTANTLLAQRQAMEAQYPSQTAPSTAPAQYQAERAILESGGSVGGTSSVSSVLTLSQGAESVASLGDWSTFQSAFESVLERPLTEDERNDIGGLSTLSNELIMLLPTDTLHQMSLGRLALLPNDFLLSTLPDLIPLFPNERLIGSEYSDPTYGPISGSGFGFTDLANLITDSQRRLELGLTQPTAFPTTTAPSATYPTEQGGTVTLPPSINTPPTVVSPAATYPTERAGVVTVPPPVNVPPGTAPTTATTPAVAQPVPPAAPATAAVPAASTVPPLDIPTTHAWVIQAGAQEWARNLARQGVPWAQITDTRLRNDLATLWRTRLSDPRYASLSPYIQAYYAATGHLPTEVELNRYTQNLPDVANILPDGTLSPKPTAKKEEEGRQPWKTPNEPLPPGYEWRFASDGTPVPYDITPGAQDLFSGWYQNPVTKDWAYDPLAGAADYLGYDRASQQRWGDLLSSFTGRTGRLPTLQEARTLAANFWGGQPSAIQSRAAQFQSLNGFWPTPYELDMGPSSTADANTGGGGQNAAGMGQVPVYVPGIGVVLVQGSAVPGVGGMGQAIVFDPMAGIPGSVRPWVKEVLNGRLTSDQVPPEMRDWVNFSLSQWKQNLPVVPPEQIPWGVPEPPVGGQGFQPTPTAAGLPFGPGQVPSGGPGWVPPTAPSTPVPWTPSTPPAVVAPSLTGVVESGDFLSAWRQYMPPGTPPPTTAQMNDIGFLATLDIRITQYLPAEILRRFPLSALYQFGNDVLLNKLTLAELARFDNSRLLGLGQWQGSGFGLDVIAQFPNERLLGTGSYAGSGFGADILAQLPITDPNRLLELGIAPPQPTTEKPTTGPTETGGTVQLPPAPAPITPAPTPTVKPSPTVTGPTETGGVTTAPTAPTTSTTLASTTLPSLLPPPPLLGESEPIPLSSYSLLPPPTV